MAEEIEIKGARVNNLKAVDVSIPRDKLVVITGLSGSGKSSLAFDTLYAEGQRRYVESLSSYARQFLGRMQKPECDYIKGIPPAIAIEQKVSSRNPRSTVGTSTEIYDYLRLLFAKVGRTYSPVSGLEVRKNTTEDVVRTMMGYGEGTRFQVMCRPRTRLERLRAEGFARVEVNGRTRLIDDVDEDRLKAGDEVFLIVDRMQAGGGKDNVARLVDSAETAFYEGGGEMALRFFPSGILHVFNTRMEADGLKFEEPSESLFAFNSPLGACPECEGFGRIIGIDERLVVPNTTLSVYDGAVVCWRGEKLGEWKTWFIKLNADRGFPVHKPYFQLTQEERDWLWHGTLPKALPEGKRRLKPEEEEWGLVSIDAFFDMLRQGQYKIQNRVMLARYRGKTICPKCRGTRLRAEASYVKVNGRSITDLVDLPVKQLLAWVEALRLDEHEAKVAERIVAELRQRLKTVVDVGLEYLTLNRLSNSLSGGESQRINLATSLGSSLVGSLYILDEPSIGLHSRDTQRLIRVLEQLRDVGNTVVVVEHDEEIMRSADWLIDLGPGAGRLGGEVVYEGEPNAERATDEEIERSKTLQFLLGRETLPVPKSRRRWNNYIEVKGARANNLRGIDVKFPLNVMTCVTGVSGSGKSSLVHDVLYLGMKRLLDEAADHPGEFLSLEGDTGEVEAIEFVDQNPIGKSTRSNPVTYVKAWDEIRKLYASQPLAKQMGYSAGFFSFNTEGGRCEECKGEGTVTVEMQFMADLVLECESCHGKRFKSSLLEVKYFGMDVHDVLEMTVNQAVEFFSLHGEKKIVERLLPLQDVGLGYIKLGQPSSTLSGGENQRVKLAYYLGLERQPRTVFIFDEPTTGLHFSDIRTLLGSFEKLLAHGHTFIIIEHNLDVVKCADHVIDLGPEGGERGGSLVAQGTPEEVARCEQSYTGQLLRAKLCNESR
ncbi:MAG: excinuclease ABC subunit UvrA [Prevotellaceae bacterium]|nr:excinuclease ABC subunit UvrA [Prevotellaceae bacterium]